MANQNVVSMKALLEAGVHFGHQTRRWNPKMAPYIYTERNGIYIIDLQKTVKKLEEAYAFVRQLSESGQSLLFVGTKKQAQEAIKDEALRCNMYYVNARWLGGMMTNFKTMRTRIDRLNQLKTMQADGTFDMLPKKEVIKHLGEIEKLEKYLGGVKEMKKLPGALFIVDTRKERNAIAEAHKLGIPVVAIADTNCDPDEIDYPIPGNDDAIRAIKLIASVMANAMIEGKQGEVTEDAAAEKAVFVQLERARVLDHTLYGTFCRRRIVRRAGIARGKRGVGIFKIRQKDAHALRERVHGIDRFISRRIPHDRDLRLCDGERFPYFRRELRAGDEIEIVHALRFQPGEDRREALDGDRFADPPAAERIVLAVHAAVFRK